MDQHYPTQPPEIYSKDLGLQKYVNNTLKQSRRVARPFKPNEISDKNSVIHTPSPKDHIASETRDDENNSPYIQNPQRMKDASLLNEIAQ